MGDTLPMEEISISIDDIQEAISPVSEPLTLRFENVNLNITTHMGKTSTTKRVLTNVSGQANPGEVLAIMGPSGSGKTSLFNILAGRPYANTDAAISGRMTLNGRTVDKRMRRRIGYCLQDDLFFANLTVKETLMLSGMLKLPREMSKEDKEAKVDALIQTLNLTKCKDTIVGSAMVRGVSGGERKRVNIAEQLIAEPAVLLLDEPTSGLDSSTATQLFRILKSLAVHSGRTVVTTIHQPSSLLFSMCDKLLLLADGKVVYHGHTRKVAHYFKEMGHPCPQHYNIADHVLDLVTLEDLDTTRTPIKANLVEAWKEMEPSKRAEFHTHGDDAEAALVTADGGEDNTKGTGKAKQGEEEQQGDSKEERKWETTWWTQFVLLSQRSFKQRRGTSMSNLQLFQTLAMSFIVGILWFQTPYREEAISDRLGCIFFTVVFWSFNSMFGILTAFPSERAVVSKERSSSSYRLSAYFMAKTMSEWPVDFVYPFISVTIYFWMAGLSPNPARYFALVGLMLLIVIAGQSFGIFFATIVMDFTKSLIIAGVTMLGFMLLGSFYVQVYNVFSEIVSYLSFLKYGYQAALVILLEDWGDDTVRFSCSSPSAFPSCPGSQISGADILAQQNINRDQGFNFGMLILLIIVVRFAGYLALRYLNQPKPIQQVDETEFDVKEE